MRLAAVDIGSNTVHALVADVVRGRLEDVAHYVEMPELGVQVARTGVIGASGKLVGYGGGLPLKKRLLELEGAISMKLAL